MPKDLAETLLAGEEVFSGRLLKVYRDRVRLPDGGESVREYIRHPGAVAIVALLDDGQVVLERQYRYPLGRDFIEIPAGKLEPGEAHLATAKREKYAQHHVRLETAPGRTTEDAYLLVPDGPGPFPAVLVVYYEAKTGIGEGQSPGRDFAARLQGTTVEGLGRRAKYLVADLSSGDVLLMHLGMSGSFRVLRGGARINPGKYHHRRSRRLAPSRSAAAAGAADSCAWTGPIFTSARPRDRATSCPSPPSTASRPAASDRACGRWPCAR